MHKIANFLFLILSLYSWTIIIQVVLSWLKPRPGTTLFNVSTALSRLTDPYLNLFRRLLPAKWTSELSIDVSPVLGILGLYLVMRGLALL